MNVDFLKYSKVLTQNTEPYCLEPLRNKALYDSVLKNNISDKKDNRIRLKLQTNFTPPSAYGIWNRDLPITHTRQNRQRKKGNTFPASPSILSRRHNVVSLIRITFQAAHQYFQNQRKHCFLLHQCLINLITSSLPDQHLYFRVPV